MESQSSISQKEVECEYPKLKLKIRGEGRDIETVLENFDEFSDLHCLDRKPERKKFCESCRKLFVFFRNSPLPFTRSWKWVCFQEEEK